MGRTSRDSSGALRGENGDQAVWPTGGSGFGAGALPRCGAVVLCREKWFVTSWSDIGGADASTRQKDHLGPHARACELVEPGGDLLFDHPAERADAERFRDFGRGPSAFGVVRTTEQPNSKAVCVEVHSTRPAELAKAVLKNNFSNHEIDREARWSSSTGAAPYGVGAVPVPVLRD